MAIQGLKNEPVNVNAEDNYTVNLNMSSTKQTNKQTTLSIQIICVLSMEKLNKVKIKNKRQYLGCTFHCCVNPIYMNP
jgi:hypothetical protein